MGGSGIGSIVGVVRGAGFQPAATLEKSFSPSRARSVSRWALLGIGGLAMTEPLRPELHAPTPADWAMLIVALALPTLVTWLYFVALADAPSAVQQAAYGAGKLVQFAL